MRNSFFEVNYRRLSAFWRFTCLCSLFTTLPVAIESTATADETPTIEYKVKASYLYNFLQFVEWPVDAFTNNTILVCVFGVDNFGTALRPITDEVVRGRAIVVRYFQDMKGLENCHVVFVSTSESHRDSQVLQSLAGRPALIVGESSGFVERGGTINLIRVGDKIRFEINQQAAKRNRLKISAQLLQLGVRE